MLLRGQTSDKISKFKKSRMSLLFYSTYITGNEELFTLKTIMGNFIYKFISLDTVVVTIDVLTARNNDVKHAETRTVQFAWLKLLFCLERIHKIDCHYSYWPNLSLVCPLNYHVTLLLSHQF